MAGETVLSLTIDASGAKQGALEFSRSANDIKRKAAEISRAVDRGSRAFNNMRVVANDNSRALDATLRSLRDVENALRRLGDATGAANQRLIEAASASSNLARDFGGNLTKNSSSLASTLVDLGLSAGLVATAFGAFRGLKLGVTLLRWISGLGRFAAAVRFAAKSMSLFRAVLVTNPLGLLVVGITTAVGAFLSYRSKADSAAEATISYEDAIRSLNSELQTAAERERELARERREGKLASAEARLEADKSRLAGLRGELTGFRKAIDAGPDSIGLRQDAITANLRKQAIPIAAEIEELETKIAKFEGVIIKVRNAPLQITPVTSSGSALDETDELESRFAALQDRLDPLAGATRAYRAELDLLLQAEHARLITSAERFELINKLGVATFDARNPVAALRRELEQERQQLMMTDDEREISTRLLEIEARLKAAGVNVSDELKTSLEQELRAIQNLRKARQDASEAQKQEDEETRKRQQDAEDEMERRAADVEASVNQIRDAAKDSFKDVIKGTESVGDAFQNLADRITDILLDLALDEIFGAAGLGPKRTGLSDLFGTIFGGLGSLSGGGGAAGPLVPASTAQLTPFLGGPGGSFDLISALHAGGIVGRDGTPRLAAANFNAAPRMHVGGVAGLRADEIPIIAQRGEEVLTRADPRHRGNRGPGGGGNVVVNVSFPNARNTQEAREAGSDIAARAAAAAQRGMARKGLG